MSEFESYEERRKENRTLLKNSSVTSQEHAGAARDAVDTAQHAPNAAADPFSIHALAEKQAGVWRTKYDEIKGLINKKIGKLKELKSQVKNHKADLAMGECGAYTHAHKGRPE